MKKLLVLLLLLCLPAAAQPTRRRPTGTTQRPVNNPRPAAAEPGASGPHLYLFGGTVTAKTLGQIAVKGSDRSLQFRLTEASKVGGDVEVGKRVVIDYKQTLDAGLYEVVHCKVLPEGQQLPKATYPEKKK